MASSGSLVVPYQPNFKVGTVIKANGSIGTTIFTEEVLSKVTDGSLVSSSELNADDPNFKDVSMADSSLEVTLMTSMTDRYKATCAEASAEVSGWGARGSAKAGFARNSGSKGSDVSIVISSHAVLRTSVATNLDDLQLEPAYEQILKAKGLASFEQEYGKYIIDSIDYGLNYAACYHFKCESSSMNQEVSASLSGFYKGLVAKGGASAAAKSAIDQASSKSEMSFESVENGTSLDYPAPYTPEEVVTRARDAVTKDNVGAAFRCTLRRLSDFVCVKKAVEDSTEQDVDRHALADDYAKVYGFVRFTAELLNPESDQEWLAATYTKMEEFLSNYSPSRLLSAPADLPTAYEKMVEDLGPLIQDLKAAGVAIPYTSAVDGDSGPVTLVNGKHYRFVNLGAQEPVYTFELRPSPMAGYYCLYRPDNDSYLDAGGTYWHGPDFPQGHDPNNGWLWWQLLPVDNNFVITSWMHYEDFNAGTLHPPAFFVGDAEGKAIGSHGYTGNDPRGLLNFVWRVTEV